MREIVLDTETTGFNPYFGDRIVEIGCVEMINRVQTNKVFHSYVNPDRSMPIDAFQVHGLSSEFLLLHPLFSEIVQDLIDFIGDAPLIIHNADFDLKFLHWEFQNANRPILRNPIVDTLSIARQQFPGSRHSLNALCQRFGIDNSGRQRHGALLDAELLAGVYIGLTGGKQTALDLPGTVPVQQPALHNAPVRPKEEGEPQAEPRFTTTFSGSIVWMEE